MSRVEANGEGIVDCGKCGGRTLWYSAKDGSDEDMKDGLYWCVDCGAAEMASIAWEAEQP